ncbi:acetyltransferase [Candidatus Omnitrophus magneticus]|uniref:Acetyltransferase n=1 Tax=Candidatus Omnitrophus magneticus TaxID=1609969 RepID=A0A0F0CQS4_9BACT|nr:acetyltransferase [Candidatus Omnitrophus magneticus]
MSRIVKAVHGLGTPPQDLNFEIEFSAYLKEKYDRPYITELYGRFINGFSDFDALMRRAIWRALASKFGHGVKIEPGVYFKYPETFEIGDNVFIGTGAFLQGRFDGKCVIGNNVWIGPHSFLDARDLIIEEYVGWGPGARILGSSHTAMPINIPIIKTDLEIKPVRIEAWADIGTGAIILPGVVIGNNSIIGAGSVVIKDIEPFSVAAGVPARLIKLRNKETTDGNKMQ